MQRSICFLEDERVGATHQDTDGASWVGDARDADQLAVWGVLLGDQLGRAQLLLGESLDRGNGLTDWPEFLKCCSKMSDYFGFLRPDLAE